MTCRSPSSPPGTARPRRSSAPCRPISPTSGSPRRSTPTASTSSATGTAGEFDAALSVHAAAVPRPGPAGPRRDRRDAGPDGARRGGLARAARRDRPERAGHPRAHQLRPLRHRPVPRACDHPGDRRRATAGALERHPVRRTLRPAAAAATSRPTSPTATGDPLAQAGATGAGETIGIVTLAALDPGRAPVLLEEHRRSAGQPPHRDGRQHRRWSRSAERRSGTGETDLDVEQSGGVAPGANVIVYQAPEHRSRVRRRLLRRRQPERRRHRLGQLGRVRDGRRRRGVRRRGDAGLRGGVRRGVPGVGRAGPVRLPVVRRLRRLRRQRRPRHDQPLGGRPRRTAPTSPRRAARRCRGPARLPARTAPGRSVTVSPAGLGLGLPVAGLRRPSTGSRSPWRPSRGRRRRRRRVQHDRADALLPAGRAGYVSTTRACST